MVREAKPRKRAHAHQRSAPEDQDQVAGRAIKKYKATRRRSPPPPPPHKEKKTALLLSDIILVCDLSQFVV
jgi:hypothetical protein